MSEKNDYSTCRICIIIRLFIISVLFLLIVALTLTDKLEYLSFINSWNIAFLILFLGSISFVVKLFVYFNEKKKLSISKKSDK